MGSSVLLGHVPLLALLPCDIHYLVSSYFGSCCRGCCCGCCDGSCRGYCSGSCCGQCSGRYGCAEWICLFRVSMIFCWSSPGLVVLQGHLFRLGLAGGCSTFVLRNSGVLDHACRCFYYQSLACSYVTFRPFPGAARLGRRSSALCLRTCHSRPQLFLYPYGGAVDRAVATCSLACPWIASIVCWC